MLLDGRKITDKHTHTQSCVRCILRTSYCSPLLFPLLLDLNFFRHLPLDLYTFFNRGHLLTITANRGPIVPLCYKSSVYPLDTLTHIITISEKTGRYQRVFIRSQHFVSRVYRKSLEDDNDLTQILYIQ